MLITNIAALKALDPSTVTEEVTVEGYYVPADKGGGIFFWDTTTPIAANNNGTIIASTVPGYTTSGRWKRIYSDAVNVLWFGAKGDGLTDDTSAFENAIATGDAVLVPETADYYHLIRFLSLVNNMAGVGRPLLKFDVTTCIKCIIEGDICIESLHIESTKNTGMGGSGPILVYTENVSDIKIQNCLLKNGRILIYNTQTNIVKNCTISGNRIDFDFSDIEHLTNQNDVIAVRGIQNVWITENVLNVLDCHRVFKFQNMVGSTETGPEYPYRSRRLYICNNTVIATTDSTKQVMDLYDYSTDLFLSNNYFEVSGFGSLIENKSGGATTFSQNTKICDNTFIFDGSGVVFQGSLGNNSIESDSGYQNIVVSGNQFKSNTTSVSSGIPVSIRFFHSVNIFGNDFKHGTDDPGLRVMFVAANLKTIISNNILHSGYINLNTATTNMSGQTFTDKFSSAVVCNNIVRNFGNGASGGIWIANIKVADGNIVLTGNEISQLTDETGITAAPIFFKDNTLKYVTVSGNSGTMANAAEERLFFYSTTNVIARIVEGDNSWNIRSASVTYDPPAIAAGTSTTTIVTVTGALAGDVVNASFSNNLSGLILSGYVSGTNTTTIVLFNPTASPIDLVSGTLKVKAIRSN
jgi:hypothetical protein